MSLSKTGNDPFVSDCRVLSQSSYTWCDKSTEFRRPKDGRIDTNIDEHHYKNSYQKFGAFSIVASPLVVFEFIAK